MIRISGLPTYHRNHHFSDPTFFSLSSLFYLAGFHEVCLVLFHLFSPIFLRSGLEFPSLIFFVTFFGKEGSGGQGGSFSWVISILVSNNRVLIFPRQFFSASPGRRIASSYPRPLLCLNFLSILRPYFQNLMDA